MVWTALRPPAPAQAIGAFRKEVLEVNRYKVGDVRPVQTKYRPTGCEGAVIVTELWVILSMTPHPENGKLANSRLQLIGLTLPEDRKN